MALTSMPYLTIQELDANGNPYVGAKLFFYAAGTTTKQNTYADANGNSANTNPVVLDSAGRATVFFQPLTYDVVLAPSTDSDPPVSPIWTRLGISAVPISSSDQDIPGTAGESLAAGDSVYMSDGSGSKVSGKWYKTDADFEYASTLALETGMVQDAIASGASGSIRKAGRITGLSGLTISTLYYASQTAGAITLTPPTNALPVGVADSTTSIIIPGRSPFASATVPGIVSTTAQTFAGVKTFPSPEWSGLPTGIGSFVTNFSAANVTKNNNTTLVDVTGLSFSVLANKNYQFMFYIHLITTAVAGIKMTLTGPAAPTGIRFGAPSSGAGSGSPSSVSAFASTLPVIPSAGASGSDMMLTVSGQLRNGANAGTVQFQFAQVTGEVSDTIVYQSSSVIAFQIS